MIIKLFFDISKDFFDQMYSQNLEHEDSNCTSLRETYDEEKGFEELLYNKKEELCYYNLCLIIIQLLKSKIRQKSE
jgi:hypothetical protein